MADADFTLVSESTHHKIFPSFSELYSAHLADPQNYLLNVFRQHYPDLSVTCTSARNPALLAFAAAGHATATLDIDDESINRIRGYVAGNARYGYTEGIYENRYFAKYQYQWGSESFILYVVTTGYMTYNFILKEPAEGETLLSNSKAVETLIMACGRWQHPVDNDFIYVYDNYWSANKKLWEQVQKASWRDVILDEEMKKTVVELMTKFFDSEDIYKSLGVPWKRGVIFHGPAGNGKTISIKALMHSLSTISSTVGREIPALYVKSAPRTYDIRQIFLQARAMAPCMLILEDIDTIVTRSSRSYFFNEVDGLENNDGIFMVASTNHLDQLDPGLSSRPSRFDRKYLFPLPNKHERTLYCEYWRNKLKSKPAIKFPRKLCPAIAGITDNFSFAYLQELFVATLLAIAGHRSEDDVRRNGGGSDDDDDGGDLDHYELWREVKKQVKALRNDMGNSNNASDSATAVIDLAGAHDCHESHTTAEKSLVHRRAQTPAAAKFCVTTPCNGHNISFPVAQHPIMPVRFDHDGKSLAQGLGFAGANGEARDMPFFASDGSLASGDSPAGFRDPTHATPVPERAVGRSAPTPANNTPFNELPFWPYQTFVTEPDFHPPVLEISKQPSATDGLFVFAPLPFTPVYPNRSVGGLIMDQAGNPIWHTANEPVGQLEVQELNGKNVLSYWTGGIGGDFIDAHGFGTITILDTAYRQINEVVLNDGTFKSGDSLENKPQPSYVDIHESHITPHGTIIVTAYNSTPYDLTAVGGPKDGWLLDSLIYEIDLATNKTLFRWSSVEHIDQLPLNGSHQLNADGSIISGNNATHPWDYFLTNAVHPLDDGYILSVRHYWSAVALDAKGNVKWNLNGVDGGDFRMLDQETAPSTFSWQHYVIPVNGTPGENVTIDMFNNDNNGRDNGTAPSTGLTLHLDLRNRTVKTISVLQDPKNVIYADSQGTFQRLPRDHKFVAYGQIPRLKEYDRDDKVVLDARFAEDNQESSYRSYLVSNWSATPYYPPKIATTRVEGKGKGKEDVVLSMSWNGATPDVYDGWLVYEGKGNGNAAVDRQKGRVVPRTGYESNVTLAEGTRSVVAAAAKGGKAIKESAELKV
ncbi:MAG: hypothetical protein Q9194_005206 [Teloschistes cf. exilis]